MRSIPAMMRSLLGVKTKKIRVLGLVVFTGKDLSPNDLFAWLVDTGRKIDSVDETRKDISEYLEVVSSQRIGDVVMIDRKDGRIVMLKTDSRRTTKHTPLP